MMHPNVVDPEQAFLLVVDLQEAYRPALHEWDRTIERACVLIRGCKLMDLPVMYTEQYPKGVGHTASELREALGDTPRFEKQTLSALQAPGLADTLLALGRRQAIVCGIETHACINQTVHELLGWGFRVHLPVDALSSRRPLEHEIGYAKLLRSGAIGGTVESVLLECVRSADHPKFKSVHALIK
jgi:nicotinamidase-related amidase